MEEKLRSRLINWKFNSALNIAKEHAILDGDEEAIEVLETLDRMFSNSGWFNGDMSKLVAVSVDMLLGRF